IRVNFILEITTVPVIVKEKKVGTLVILHNVTREKLVDRMKSEFVTLAAHQLRTPLSAVKWSLMMLLDEDLGKLNKEQKSFLQDTYKTNEKMISLVNSLLNVSEIEEGKYLSKIVLSSIEDIIQSIVDAHKKEMEKRKLRFEFKKPREQLPKLMLDVEKMKIAIKNIFDNALKYTLPGGKVSISLKGDEKEIEVQIQDTGVGILQYQQGKVFTKFFRGANIIKMETEGTGLGLFISKNIIEAHGGRIWFESEEGKGSTFYFTIPVKERFGEFLTEEFY
ncbi:HAMP domain-containing histidine kinase, partial [Patescibacteria group bacterium]|nr:HAMP domain-containing histidine kinase [Patescibacteria group bacterium]